MIIKNIYRYIYDTYLKWSDVTFIGLINRKLEQKFGKNRNEFNNINLSSIKKYYRDNKIKKGNIKKTILVEAMHIQASPVLHLNMIQLLISSTDKSRVIGYSNFREPVNEKIYNAFGVEEFITIYQVLNFKVVFLSILKTITTFFNGSKFTKLTNIKVMVDDVDIGEHIYDNFLRRELVGTHRKKTFKYFLYIYRGCYYYYSSKKILSKLDITDIIVNSKVYANGIIIKACASISKDINIWQTESYSYSDKFCLSKTVTSRCGDEIPGERIFKNKYYDLIMNVYSIKELNKIFESFTNIILPWTENNNCNEISNEKDLQIHNYDKKRKNIFIFPHAFNDAVRLANKNIYADYYIWLIDVLKILSTNDRLNIFVKPHPHEYRYHYKESSKDVVDNILNSSPKANIFYIDQDIKKDFLYDFSDVILTVWGSIGLEAPCYGVPVITAARATYYEANTTINSENYIEFKNNLDNIHMLNGMTEEKIFKAKVVYMFTALVKYVDFDFDFDKDVESDLDRYNLINLYFHNLVQIKDTKIYKLFVESMNNDFDELINVYILNKYNK